MSHREFLNEIWASNDSFTLSPELQRALDQDAELRAEYAAARQLLEFLK